MVSVVLCRTRRMDVKRRSLSSLHLIVYFLASGLTFTNAMHRSEKAFSIYQKFEIKEETCESWDHFGSFGTCCVFVVTGNNGRNTATSNCSYIQNPDFPDETTYGGNFEYKIKTSSYEDICQIRLDFEDFLLFGTGVNDETRGCETDSFNVKTSEIFSLVPTICGRSSRQHIYFSVDNSANLEFNIQSDSALWDIKVSLIECTSPMLPPDGCLQYLTEQTGDIITFNFFNLEESHLLNLDYSVCIRPQAGFCCVQYQTCENEPDSLGEVFSLSDSEFGARQDDDCISTDHIEIPNSASQCIRNANLAFNHKYCGSYFSSSQGAMSNSPVCTCSPPFFVHIYTDGSPDHEAGKISTQVYRRIAARGLCLEYTQIPC